LLDSLSALLLQEFQPLPKTTQLTLSHENLPGMLAHIAKVLGNAQVNILAFLTTTSGSEGLTHLIVDRLDTAKKAFASAGLVCTEADVLQLELPNTPGALAKFARKLAEEDINITLGYATSEKGSKKTSVVLAVSDLDKAAIIR
jgi:hypothetical protein